MDVKQFQRIAKALADPRRFQILERIGKCKNGDVACSELRCAFPISAATLSHHLKELTKAGLIEIRRERQFAHIKLRRDVWRKYLAHLRQLA